MYLSVMNSKMIVAIYIFINYFRLKLHSIRMYNYRFKLLLMITIINKTFSRSMNNFLRFTQFLLFLSFAHTLFHSLFVFSSHSQHNEKNKKKKLIFQNCDDYFFFTPIYHTPEMYVRQCGYILLIYKSLHTYDRYSFHFC